MYPNPWPDGIINAVWNKGKVIDSCDPELWRRDCYGTPMQYNQYGNRNSKYGWEIDHIKPKSKGGSDDLSNLQPLQWQNNIKKGDS